MDTNEEEGKDNFDFFQDYEQKENEKIDRLIQQVEDELYQDSDINTLSCQPVIHNAKQEDNEGMFTLWRKLFPHLRIRGKSICLSQNVLSSPSSKKNLSSSSSSSEIFAIHSDKEKDDTNMKVQKWLEDECIQCLVKELYSLSSARK